MSIIDSSNYGGSVNVTGYTFPFLFYNCTGLTHADGLFTTTHAAVKREYYNSFRGCINLLSAPILNHETVNENAYCGMFRDCWALTTPPVILAQEIKGFGLKSMFLDCTGLTQTPTLHINAFKDTHQCEGMFENCISLAQTQTLPNITPTTGTYKRMFANCWSLTTAPELPSVTLSNSAYTAMFENCTGLTEAPLLPATALTDYCYYEMFKGCSQLSAITMLASSNLSATDALTNWVSGVSPTGVFVKEVYATLPTGNNGIPQGWLALSNGITLSKNRIDCESGTTETITVTSLNS